MLRIGVKEDALESFVLDVYNRCKDIGILPENISSYLADLLEFSKTAPLSKIPHYIKEKNDEKIKLEEEIQKLKAEIGTLQQEKENAELLRDTILQDVKITSVTIKWYSDLKVELGKYGIPVDDISKLAKLVNGIKQYQYDVQNVINQFLDLEIRRINYKYLQENVPPLENRKTYLETMISMHNQALSNYQKLEIMGFGLNQLQYLWGF
jgi:chromosome segregation ATPase